MISLNDFREARVAISGELAPTPLVRLNAPDSKQKIYLKLENLQPVGSFKVRGAINAFRSAPVEIFRKGVLTASAGNWAQGVAWVAREKEIPCTIIVPEGAPATKIAAIERLGAEYISVPYDRWWRCMENRHFEGLPGYFLHPFEDEPVMAGNGTIAFELVEDLPSVDVVLVPWGGGGLAVGIAAAFRMLGSEARVFGVEVETAAPLTASFAADRMVSLERKPSFVDGIGSGRLLPNMWELAQEFIDSSFTASVEEVKSALRLIFERNHVVAEGAGACALAVALSGEIDAEHIVCIVSGGNIDVDVFSAILEG